uniref:Immunoglobulin V-set domain-containing protein n=1 Tax=Nothobranchius furzeri TaxID=105023 RepID=A0A1A7ZUB9_NOTFU
MMLGVCWRTIILLSYVPSQVLLQQSTKGCDEPRVEVLVLSARSHPPVFVPCPALPANAQEVIMELFKDQESIWKCKTDISSKQQCNQTQLNIQPHKNEFNQTDGLKIMALPRTSQAIYRCQVGIEYPPPYKLMNSAERVLVLEKDKVQGTRKTGECLRRLHMYAQRTTPSSACFFQKITAPQRNNQQKTAIDYHGSG